MVGNSRWRMVDKGCFIVVDNGRLPVHVWRYLLVPLFTGAKAWCSLGAVVQWEYVGESVGKEMSYSGSRNNLLVNQPHCFMAPFGCWHPLLEWSISARGDITMIPAAKAHLERLPTSCTAADFSVASTMLLPWERSQLEEPKWTCHKRNNQKESRSKESRSKQEQDWQWQ